MWNVVLGRKRQSRNVRIVRKKVDVGGASRLACVQEAVCGSSELSAVFAESGLDRSSDVWCLSSTVVVRYQEGKTLRDVFWKRRSCPLLIRSRMSVYVRHGCADETDQRKTLGIENSVMAD